MSIRNFLLKRLILEEKNSLALTIVIILSIALGEIIIILTISIMNGFQNDFFLSITNVESGNLKIENELTQEEIKKIKKIEGIKHINKIYETQGIGIQNYYYPTILNIIAVDIKDLKKDQNFISFTGLEKDELDLKDNEIIIGNVLSHNFNLFENDPLELIITDEIKTLISLENDIKSFKIKSIFKSNYAKINETLIFMNIDYFIKNKILHNSGINYQVKTKNLNPSNKLIEKIKAVNPKIKAKTWNEYNKEFYKILKIERNTMLIILASIFIVIAVNTYYLQKRIIINKNKAILILLAMGLRIKKIKQIFFIHSIIICTVGGLLGLTLGISISLNINEILKIIDNLVNTLINFLNQILALKIDGIKIQIVKNTITPKLFLSDLTFTFCFACFSTMYSSMKATKKIGSQKNIETINGQ
ncbi:ABC transporter permease [Borreliella burgdorferi]|uniref:ABC transporter permease n=2 Tax=Borreliella burgdorferi TaxID=139 RepID=UPI00016B3357|nr:FtsX-like permease family protein [Borreliella burgdorferi]EEC21565.1 lipoprotein releasing factor [Borreliella burgdorferi 156a]MCD2331471.1 FtsX-like permease family protein [Borreliella burgdorferi]MCR8909343.1 FtsX-like permease family protein [Borreliella burgdorferi 297]MDK7383351.1 FtsX-like permease family protein [Borreliella burgdorferi]PRQ93867.1 ABC transporter permease [Borreliella burgdorferi]